MAQPSNDIPPQQNSFHAESAVYRQPECVESIILQILQTMQGAKMNIAEENFCFQTKI